MALIDEYRKNGFVLLRRFFEPESVERVRQDAKQVFIRQMRHARILDGAPRTEAEFEEAMGRFFEADTAAFINCGKQCQHLISLHSIVVSPHLVDQVRALGIESPVICTRPVMYFNARKLAKSEVYYKTPPHQDWRSMQGSLNSMVVWFPMVDVDRSLGALEVVPKSHLVGLQDSHEDEWYRRIDGLRDEDFVSVEVKTGDALFFSSFLVHRSGDNVTDAIRWSCHLRYNDLADPTFVERKVPNPYVYKPQQELITPGFPSRDALARTFAG